MTTPSDPTRQAIESHLKNVENIVKSFTEEFYDFYNQELSTANDAEFEAAIQRAKQNADSRIEKLSQALESAGSSLLKNLETAAGQEDKKILQSIESEIENL